MKRIKQINSELAEVYDENRIVQSCVTGRKFKKKSTESHVYPIMLSVTKEEIDGEWIIHQ